MITRVRGTLTARGLDRIEVMTAAGVAYELHIPLGVLELLPRVGEAVDLHTALVVKEDAWLLYGFATERDRALFNTVTSASGVGPALGLGLISALGSTRLVRAIRDRDLTTLQTAPRVGRKIAERLCVELADRMKDFADGDTPAPQEALDGGAADAARALISLGYSQTDAERAVRMAVGHAPQGGGTADLVRAALVELQRR
jgi:Holliday junction DNA helicase RuvA